MLVTRRFFMRGMAAFCLGIAACGSVLDGPVVLRQRRSQTRFFSSDSAGLGDGSSWANRAAIIAGDGSWSKHIEPGDTIVIMGGTWTCR